MGFVERAAKDIIEDGILLTRNVTQFEKIGLDCGGQPKQQRRQVEVSVNGGVPQGPLK